MPIIETVQDLERGCAALTAATPVYGRIIEVTGLPPLRLKPQGFAALSEIIISQQLSTASAGAIWARVAARIQPYEPGLLLAADNKTLRGCGLSAGKVETLKGLASAIAAGDLQLERLATLDDDVVRDALCRLSGIGPWTADIYLLSCLGRADVWPGGDLALQKAAMAAFGLDARPDMRATQALAEPWRPWRAVAARLLWAYYRVAVEGKTG